MNKTLERLISLYNLLKENDELFIYSFIVGNRDTSHDFFSTEDWKLKLVIDRFPNFEKAEKDPQIYWKLLAGKIIIINRNTKNVYSEYSFTHRVIRGKTKLILNYNPLGNEEDRLFSIEIESDTTSLLEIESDTTSLLEIESDTTSLYITFKVKNIINTWKTILENSDYKFIKDSIKKLETLSYKEYREGKLKTKEEYTFLSR